jgi:predicted transcriptional regulator
MASKTKTREINIVDESGVFSTFFKRFSTEKDKSENLDLDSLAALRKLLSNEKAKILHTIKTKKPNSIYELSKKLNRDFKSVSEDIKLLQRFGFIALEHAKTGKRNRLKPVVSVDKMIITIQI